MSTWLLYGAGKCYLHLHVTSLFDVIYTHSCTPLKQQLHSAHSGGLRHDLPCGVRLPTRDRFDLDA